MTNSDGFSTYTDEFLEENRKFEALEKRLVSEATVLEGAVYRHYNEDGSFAGISKGEPLKATLREIRKAKELALREESSKAIIPIKTPAPAELTETSKSAYKQLIETNPPGQEENIKQIKEKFSDVTTEDGTPLS